MTKNFRNFLIDGLELKTISNNYSVFTKTVSDDKNKIVVRVSDEHLLETKYGYALILDEETVVFLKEWQVERNYFNNVVILSRQYFNPKKWGTHSDFIGINEESHNFDSWLNVASEQKEIKFYR